MGITGLMNANNHSSTRENDSNTVKEIATEIKDLNNPESKTLLQVCVVFHATCTSAYSCWADDTPMEQVYEWADNIQNNYCMIDSPYQP